MKQPPFSRIATGMAAGIVLIFEFAAGMLYVHIGPVPALAVTRTAQLAGLGVLLILADRYRPHPIAGPSRFRRGIRTGLTLSFLLGAGAGLAGIVLAAAGMDPVSLIRPAVPETHRFLFFLTAVVIGPVAEELFFRGVLYPFFRPLGMIPATGITTLLFVLFHYTGAGIPLVPLVGGIVFAAAYEQSKTLAAPVIIHVLGNMAVYLTIFLP